MKTEHVNRTETDPKAGRTKAKTMLLKLIKNIGQSHNRGKSKRNGTNTTMIVVSGYFLDDGRDTTRFIQIHANTKA